MIYLLNYTLCYCMHFQDLDKCTEARGSQLACIDSTFEYLKAGGRLDCSCKGDTMVNKQLLNLLEEMKGYGGGEEPDLEMVCTQNDPCFKWNQ